MIHHPMRIAAFVLAVLGRFAGTVSADATHMEMRLLPKPVVLYPPKPAAPTVAIYGLTCNGTNPDAYVVFQVATDSDGETWSYGTRRMSINGVQIRLDGRQIWKTNQIVWSTPPDPTETWTYFYTPRELLMDREENPKAAE